jgi:hypothetical protein
MNSKSAINTLLKSRASLRAKLTALEEKREPLTDELERIDGALKALRHAESTEAAPGDAAATAAESHAEPIPPQTEAGDADTKNVTVPDFMVRGAKNPTV